MTTSRRLTPRVALAAAALLLPLAACGSNDAGAGAAGSDDLDNLSAQQLAKKAASEGSVTWYTTVSEDDIPGVVQAFNKVYPDIKIDALRLSADDIPPRVMTEQRGGKYNADVISGESSQVAQLIAAKALQPYTPKDLAPLPAGLKLPEGYEGVLYGQTTVIAYNPKVLKKKGLPAPTTWEDLTDPKYKGQFSIDPSAVNWYDSEVNAIGADKAEALVKALGANSPVIVESHTQAVTDVEAGEPAIAATAYGYKASDDMKDNPGTLNFVNPTPLPASLVMMDMAKNAPHPAAARLFIDWLASRQGQQAVTDVTNHTSLHPAVKPDPKVWNPAKWPPAWGNPMLPADDYNSELKTLGDALGAS
ncbi:MAG: ABC transporter substrate-binding protein [Acidimicrobiaceae bacterium]|nr:ABC transporter substrate-binding protein [Acidimicrobiaceae bacterium]